MSMKAARRGKIAVAMSGGVDSSVAAVLLKEQGFDVFGITMVFAKTCGNKSLDDAKAVAENIGIRHYSVNFSQKMQKKVIDYFCREYKKGRTPNPCVRCNQLVKFEELLEKTLSLGADFLATGHYARLKRTAQGVFLCKAKDLKKDQSYFLYRLDQAQLKRARFPLGEYTKEQVRQAARQHDLPVAEKADSQEICFIPGNDYRQFLLQRIPQVARPGVFVNRENKVLGAHKGVAFYTIGQREGLGIALGYPAYVTAIDPKSNTIVLGAKEDALSREFFVTEACFPHGPLKKKVAARVRIRYNHKEAPAEIIPAGRKYKIILKSPQFAVTPGQSAVFYDGDIVLGGGIIEKVDR